MTEQEIRDKIAQLTLEEKAIMCAQVIDFDAGRLYAGHAPGIGIEGLFHSDNSRGSVEEYRYQTEEERKKMTHATTFPHMAALAATWDNELARAVGRANGTEARDNGVTLLVRPGVNIKRSPLCGRNFEYFSEDPYLTGELAGSYIQGVQSTHTASCIKHFAVNNQEYERMTTNAVVSERALREIYLEPFRIAIQKGNPWSLMTSYNKINGEWSNSNKHLLTDILRKEWGYTGMVQSDGFAVHTNKVEAHRNGMDTEGNEYHEHTGELLDAVYRGEISVERIDEICATLMRLYDKVQGPAVKADYDGNHELAVKVEEAAVVLLKNDGLLPLNPEADGLAVIGSIAEYPPYCGGGSGHTNARIMTCGLDRIRELAEKEVSYSEGYPNVGDMEANDEKLVADAVSAAANAKTVLAFVGLPAPLEGEGYDRTTLKLPLGQRRMLDEVLSVNENVVLCVHAGAAVDLSDYAGRVKGILFLWLGGEGVGTACGNVLFGLAEPGGRLPETFPLRLEDTPAYLSFPAYPSNMHDVWYGEGIYVGYRWYEARKIPVLYPFGYGLSYTTFEFSNLRADCERVTVNVRNTGERSGTQVVQIYVRDVVHSAPRPEKELKGFGKVYLEPGEDKDVEIVLGDHAFAFWNENTGKWCVESGEFEIMAGDSSQNILLRKTIEIESDDRYMLYSTMTPVEWICKAKNLKAACEGLPDTIYETLYAARDMICAFPFYRLRYPQMGFVPISQEQMDTILYRLNTYHE